MKTYKRQSGFSLLEVMMAVVVLMMGMVFVASMFPVGLYNSRQNVDRTINAVESHNAAIMAELIMENTGKQDRFIQTAFGLPANRVEALTINEYSFDDFYDRVNSVPTGNLSVGSSLNQVHFFPRPNILSDSGRVIIADFEFESNGSTYVNLTSMASNFFGTPYSVFATQYDPFALITDIGSFSGLSTFFNPNTNSKLNYYIISLAPDINNAYILGEEYRNDGTRMSGDIGKIFCPAIDYDSPEVIKAAYGSGGTIYDYIYKEALKQKYTWAAAYAERESRNKPFDLSIFILKQGGDNVSYAVQAPETAVVRNLGETYIQQQGGAGSYSCIGKTANVYPLGLKFDCRFPVPWLVYIDSPVYNTNTFYVNEHIADILRPGSVIVDADPEYVSLSGVPDNFNNQIGGVFRVKDIEAQVNVSGGFTGYYKVTLQTPLNDAGNQNYLFAFWVFPPAIDRTTGEFMDEQPVIDVIQKQYWR